MRVIGLICLAVVAAGEVDVLKGADPALGDPKTIDLAKDYACTSCLAVAWELAELLNEEEKSPTYVKGLKKKEDSKQKVSDLRAMEILEKLCPLVDKYALYTNKDTDTTLFRRFNKEKGMGEHKRSQEITSHLLRIHCDKLVEKHEAELEELIKTGHGFGKSNAEAIGYALCAFREKACKDKTEVDALLPMSHEYREMKIENTLKLRELLKENEEKKAREEAELMGKGEAKEAEANKTEETAADKDKEAGEEKVTVEAKTEEL